MNRAYLLTDIDQKLYREFKTACAHYDISMRDTLIKHMENIAEDYRQDRIIYDKTVIQTKKGGKKK